MAAVQGAFVGIVFSIFVLASQVSAAQFTPLTLEQLSRSRGFAALLVYYTFAILTNIYLMETLSLPSTIPYVPAGWNTPLGLGAGLTTASLLSLLIARQLLAELTTPEHLLERTAKSVSRQAFTESKTEEPSKPTPPTRTPLFTIERILVAAHNDNDEYTTQQAIHQLWSVTNRFLTPPVVIGAGFISPSPASYTEDLDIEKLLNYWTTAAKYGAKGPLSRVKRTAIAQRHIVSALLSANEVPKAIEQLEHLYDLTTAAFEYGNDQSVLSGYEQFADEITVHDSSSPLALVIRHHAQFVEGQIEKLEIKEESESGGLRNTFFSAIISNYVVLLEQVWVSDLSNPVKRKRANMIIRQLETDLTGIFEIFDEQPNPGPLKQTLLTELHRQFIHAASSLDVKNVQSTNRYIVIISELSIALDRRPETVADSLLKCLNEGGDRIEILEARLQDWSPDDSYQRELKPLAVEEQEVTDIIECIGTEMR
ncbi:hypothetical protein [Haloarchaeobius sp. DFWS5]|uniref:hypothetical protein n=1 Tax=Haloarchaeobius sp. DFWS5 TaxID=3446114 RepID=UPI003EB875BE